MGLKADDPTRRTAADKILIFVVWILSLLYSRGLDETYFRGRGPIERQNVTTGCLVLVGGWKIKKDRVQFSTEESIPFYSHDML